VGSSDHLKHTVPRPVGGCRASSIQPGLKEARRGIHLASSRDSLEGLSSLTLEPLLRPQQRED